MIIAVQGKAFERVYAEHAEALLRFLIFRTGDRVLAEDLLADTFERVLRAGSRFDPRKASEKTWLYTIALNLLRDHARREGVAERALERVGPADHPGGGAFEHAEVQGDLHRALETLAPEERELMALRFGADLTLPEIAKALGERRTTVEGRFYRALRKLRGRLE